MATSPEAAAPTAPTTEAAAPTVPTTPWHELADHILADKLHILNVSFLIDGLVEKRGGCAGNIAYTLALMGEKPLILATAGKNFSEYGAFLESNVTRGVNHGSIHARSQPRPPVRLSGPGRTAPQRASHW